MALSDVKTDWRPVKKWVAPVVEEICRDREIFFVWGFSNKPNGEHRLGRALDFSILEFGNGVKNPGRARTKLGDELAEYLWKNRKRLNIWYVIWNRRIISITRPEDGWIAYHGKSPHTDHVHVSFKKSGTYEPPEDDMPNARDVANEVLFSDVIPNADNKKNPKMTLAGAISDIEATQDRHSKELAEIKKHLVAISRKLNA